MSERDRYPAGVPCWVETLQPDPRAAAAFYAGVLGWEFTGPGPMPGGGNYYVGRLGGRDVNDALARVRQAGGTVLVEARGAMPEQAAAKLGRRVLVAPHRELVFDRAVLAG